MKQCTVCKKLKALECFGKCTKAKDGLRFECRECVAKYGARYYLINRAKILNEKREEREKDRESSRRLARQAYWRNPRKAILRTIAWQKKHPEHVRRMNKEWKQNNPEKIKQHEKREYQKRQSSVTWRLNNNVRTDITGTLKRGG